MSDDDVLHIAEVFEFGAVEALLVGLGDDLFELLVVPGLIGEPGEMGLGFFQGCRAGGYAQHVYEVGESAKPGTATDIEPVGVVGFEEHLYETGALLEGVEAALAYGFDGQVGQVAG